ncbi:hypothetical protein [Plantactinospora sp. CA-290183]|uniref:hypothetical protein n=1 Tax=Plantactinospora sp. CA-290183 TaxID=3240006 RepID=UPI003D8C34FC
MLDADVRGGYAGVTNWYGQDVEQMWAKLANQQTDSHWQHVGSWQKTYELSSMHLSRMKEYRDNLIQAWSPEKNEAARAYVVRLDAIIKQVQDVYDTAVTNHQALKSVTMALWDSRFNLEKIHKEYLSKKQAKADYDQRVAFERDSQLPGVSLGDPPATQADLDNLNNQARSIMYSLSNDLGLAQMQLRKPLPPPKELGRVNEPGGETGAGDGGGFVGSNPPVLPPVVPVSNGGGGYSPPSSPPPPSTYSPVTQPVASSGPVLGNAGPVAPPAPPPPPPVITPTPTPGPGPSPILPPPLPGPMPPSPYPSNGQGLPIKPGIGTHAGLPPRPAMPPGGMIGGAPGAGLAQPGAGASPARRINPVGGVIGGGGAGTSPMGSAGQRPGQNFGTASGARAGNSRKEDETSQHWDPDNPWETDEGVAPVVLPPRETGRIDPGPAIGFNR